eukprot:4898065-Amphidinium_carterae.1
MDWRAALDMTLAADAAGRYSIGTETGCALPCAPACEARDQALNRATELMAVATVTADQQKELECLEEACRLRAEWLHANHLD